MEKTFTASDHPRWANKALVALFILFLCLPTFDVIFDLDTKPIRDENRLPAPFPQWHWAFDEIQNYAVNFEAYFNDHFGFRKQLIKWQNKLRNGIFRDQNSRRRVIIGDEGWLFLSDNQMIEHFRGTLQFTVQDLLNWKTLLELRRDSLARQGVEFVFVVAPDKHSIYPEYLPEWLRKLSGRTKLDQFIAYMHENSTVEVVDLRPALLSAKSKMPAYQKTDTHWNSFGAFVAYEELLRTIHKKRPELAPLSMDDFTIIINPASGGDLAAFAGTSEAEPNCIKLVSKDNSIAQKMNEGPSLNTATITNDQTYLNVVIYHDSFGEYWQPFTPFNFRTTQFNKKNHLKAVDFESALKLAKKPDVVIVEMVERYFNTIDAIKIIQNTNTDSR